MRPLNHWPALTSSVSVFHISNRTCLDGPRRNTTATGAFLARRTYSLVLGRGAFIGCLARHSRSHERVHALLIDYVQQLERRSARLLLAYLPLLHRGDAGVEKGGEDCLTH